MTFLVFLLVKKYIPLPNKSNNGLCNPRKNFLSWYLGFWWVNRTF